MYCTLKTGYFTFVFITLKMLVFFYWENDREGRKTMDFVSTLLTSMTTIEPGSSLELQCTVLTTASFHLQNYCDTSVALLSPARVEVCKTKSVSSF